MKKVLTTCCALALMAGMSQGATITTDWQSAISSEQHPTYAGEARYYHVSINASNPGIGSYASTISGSNTPAGTFTRSFDAPVLAWSFLGGSNNSVSGKVEEGGGLISWATSDDAFDGFCQGQLRFWDVTDPGASIATGGADPYNSPTPAPDGGGGGYRSFGGAVTTVDITGLATGSVYAFYGSFSAKPTVSVIMRDTDGGAPDLTIADAHLNGDTANRTEYYAAEIDFVTDGVYDQIEYTWLANGVDYTGNGRGAGAVVTGVAIPEPSTFALLGLGVITALIVRRRSK